MQHLSGHPGVVTLKAVYEDKESFYLVMEFCSGGRLLDHMPKGKQYSEHRAANVLKELVWVIKYCHDMGVVHCDIKPENILLTFSGQMKLADFGLAVRVSNGNADSINVANFQCKFGIVYILAHTESFFLFKKIPLWELIV